MRRPSGGAGALDVEGSRLTRGLGAIGDSSRHAGTPQDRPPSLEYRSSPFRLLAAIAEPSWLTASPRISNSNFVASLRHDAPESWLCKIVPADPASHSPCLPSAQMTQYSPTTPGFRRVQVLPASSDTSIVPPLPTTQSWRCTLVIERRSATTSTWCLAHVLPSLSVVRTMPPAPTT